MTSQSAAPPPSAATGEDGWVEITAPGCVRHLGDGRVSIRLGDLGSGVMAVRAGEGGALPDEPTEDMTTAGGRILGSSMRWENQIQRARVVWETMVKAFRTGDMPAIPQNRKGADIPDPDRSALQSRVRVLEGALTECKRCIEAPDFKSKPLLARIYAALSSPAAAKTTADELKEKG